MTEEITIKDALWLVVQTGRLALVEGLGREEVQEKLTALSHDNHIRIRAEGILSLARQFVDIKAKAKDPLLVQKAFRNQHRTPASTGNGVQSRTTSR